MGYELTGLENRIAVVTGAGRLRGIGRAIALEMARAGCHVAITGTGRSPDRFPESERAVGWRDIESVADEIRAMGRKALPVVSNAAEPADVEQLLERVVAEFGRVDFVVNNAAAPRGADRVPVLQMPVDAWDNVIRVNLRGVFLMSKLFGRRLVDQVEGGVIVNISSIQGKLGLPNNSAYGASKAAVHSLTAAMAQEVGPAKVRVNAICPGLVDTARMEDLHGDPWKALLQQIPLRRASEGDDIGFLTVYLCSDQGSWVTGQSINVDGGMAGFRGL
jgi:NAD(P)-dependent dehydrogenase (short-subunit alcohol dehydrogenase family)